MEATLLLTLGPVKEKMGDRGSKDAEAALGRTRNRRYLGREQGRARLGAVFEQT